MTRVVLIVSAAIAIGLSGCGRSAGQVSDPVKVTGQVIMANGQPVKDVVLTLQPVSKGQMAGFILDAEGKFTGEAVPGKYAYYISPMEGKTEAVRKTEAALKGIPENYRAASMDRTVEVTSSGTDLQIKLN